VPGRGGRLANEEGPNHRASGSSMDGVVEEGEDDVVGVDDVDVGVGVDDVVDDDDEPNEKGGKVFSCRGREERLESCE